MFVDTHMHKCRGERNRAGEAEGFGLPRREEGQPWVWSADGAQLVPGLIGSSGLLFHGPGALIMHAFWKGITSQASLS